MENRNGFEQKCALKGAESKFYYHFFLFLLAVCKLLTNL